MRSLRLDSQLQMSIRLEICEKNPCLNQPGIKIRGADEISKQVTVDREESKSKVGAWQVSIFRSWEDLEETAKKTEEWPLKWEANRAPDQYPRGKGGHVSRSN